MKTPPTGPTGIRSASGLTGSFDVVSETPEAGVELEYRVIRFNFVPLDPAQLDGTESISDEGDDLGRVRLLDDGTLTMSLTVPTELFDGLTFELDSYDSRPNGYEFDNGRLALRGVRLTTAPDEPYFRLPLIYLWADPE